MFDALHFLSTIRFNSVCWKSNETKKRFFLFSTSTCLLENYLYISICVRLSKRLYICTWQKMARPIFCMPSHFLHFIWIEVSLCLHCFFALMFKFSFSITSHLCACLVPFLGFVFLVVLNFKFLFSICSYVCKFICVCLFVCLFFGSYCYLFSRCNT